MCSCNKLAADPQALMLNKVLLFLTSAFKGVQEKVFYRVCTQQER